MRRPDSRVCWIDPPAEIEHNVHPRFRGDAGLVTAMLDWEDDRRRSLKTEGSLQTLTASTFVDDAITAALLFITRDRSCPRGPQCDHWWARRSTRDGSASIGTPGNPRG
jgi:hypothetical protein